MQGGIGDWIVRRAQRKPTATSLVDGDTGRRVSYAELERSVATLAASMHDLGLRRGDRVVVLMENSVEFTEVMFAVANLGAVCVPVNFRLSAGEIAYILADSGATMVAVSERLHPLADAALAHGTHGVRHVIADAPTELIRDVPISDLATPTAGKGPRRPDAAIGPDDLCMIMYTSGTTGNPKGVMLTHGNMLWNALNWATIGTGLSGTAVTLAVAPMFHIGALGNSVLPFLYAGATVVTVRAFEPRRTLELIGEHGVTTQFMVPSMWAALSQVPDFDSHDVSTVEFVLCGGAPCPLPVIDFYQRRGWRFLEGLGMTETAPCALLRRSPRPAGRTDSDGFVTLVDRKKDMIISGGENVYPIEVEQVLFGHPAVEDVAVIGTPDERWGETVVAVVVRRPATDVEPGELIGFARDRIAHYKCPRRVEFRDELPRTATGKVLKRDLRVQYTGAAGSVHR